MVKKGKIKEKRKQEWWRLLWREDKSAKILEIKAKRYSYYLKVEKLDARRGLNI